jgi:FK506-binding protein 4/5
MEEDFDLPTESEMEMPEEEEEMMSPIQKVGEEKEIGNNGLKKKLVKEGEGWETPDIGDQVEGNCRVLC